MTIRAFVFDAYGTLYDVQSVMRTVEAHYPGKGEFITHVWRLKQLEYTWLRTCMDDFADFTAVTRDSLVFTLRAAGIDADDETITTVAKAYLSLAPAPEAEDALVALKGLPRAILSNGSVGMLEALVRNSRLDAHLEHIISVDAARAFKPSRKAYALAGPVTGVEPGETMFVSSNGFDIAGAKAFGFQVAWIRRSGHPDPALPGAGPSGTFQALRLHEEELGHRADHIFPALTALANLA